MAKMDYLYKAKRKVFILKFECPNCHCKHYDGDANTGISGIGNCSNGTAPTLNNLCNLSWEGADCDEYEEK